MEPRVAFFTLGCKVNQYETSAMMRQFASGGFTIVPFGERAEVYVLNSCTVTAEGDKKSRQLLRRARRQSPDAVLALCGCFPQAFPEQAASVPEADVVCGAANRSRLLELVRRRLREGARVVEISPQTADFEPLSAESFPEHTRAFVKIQDGCRGKCSYCIIPKARGPVRSKPIGDLIRELEALAGRGYLEAVLVGINLSSYGEDLGLRLVDAAEAACGVERLCRVRLGSLEPEGLAIRDLEALAGHPAFCPQFHLSLQSGCEKTLRRMRRPYTARSYRELARQIRSIFENPALTTDLMVGFPGETGEDFLESMAFAREIGFADIHIFPFSPRPGTEAAALPEQLPAREKAERAKRMEELAGKSRDAFLQSQVGRECRVLFEQTPPDKPCAGHSENHTPVFVEKTPFLRGKLLRVKIVGVQGGRCRGELLE